MADAEAAPIRSNLAPDVEPDAMGMAELYTPPSAKPSLLDSPSAFTSLDDVPDYIGSTITNARKRRKAFASTEIGRKLLSNNLGYTPL